MRDKRKPTYADKMNQNRKARRKNLQSSERTGTEEKRNNRKTEQGKRPRSGNGENARSEKRKSSRFQNNHIANDRYGKGRSAGPEKTKAEKSKTEKQKPENLKPDKQAFPCPYAKTCGGCSLLHLSYEQQLQQKQQYESQLFSKFSRVDGIAGMKNPLHYRNKVHGVVMTDKKGNGYTGIYEEKSHRVTRVDRCLIEDKKADEVMQSVAGLMKSFKMKAYNEDTGYGFLRHILIRTAHSTGQIMVVLVTASPVFPSKNNFVKALRKLHPEITTIVANVNNRNTSMVLGDKQQILYGKGYIEDVLCGKRFRLSPKSFYQVNSLQTEVLYNKAIQFAGLTGTETVIDAYSGIGTIGIIASDKAKKVISVELNRDAVKDAVKNAKLNNVHNVTFYNEDAGEFMLKMAENEQRADVVFLDPPRSGSDRQFLDALLTLSPKRIVYISCGPESLQRDLNYLTSKGYHVKKIQPVDMFPMTGHIENVVLLSKESVTE